MSTDSTAAVVASLPAPVAAARPRLHRVTVVLAFLSIYLIWGSTYLAIRYAVETIPPLYTAGLRHLTAGMILLVWHWAEQKVPSGLASLIIASEPLWVFLLTAIAARQWRLNGTLLGGIFLGFGGVGLLMGRSALNSGPGVFVGSLAVLLGAFSWSLGIVDRKSTRLNSSHMSISYAVFCLKK